MFPTIKFLNPKWKNKTLKTEALITELTAAVKELVNGIAKISEMYKDEPYLLSITEFFKQHKDFSKTAVYAAQMNTAYKKEQAAKAAAEAAAQNTLQNAPQDATTESNITTLNETQNTVNVDSGQSQKLYKGKFEVEATKEQIIALGNYMKANGIKFTTIK